MSERPSFPLKTVEPEYLDGDLVHPGNPLYGIVWINPERMSGEPCFFGTRVPIKNLFDYLEGNETIDAFLDDFPGVLREEVVAVLDLAREKLTDARRQRQGRGVKLLLDHCVPHGLVRHLPDHEVATTSGCGWQKLRNGDLLKAAANAGFAAMITTDQNLRHQQNVDRLPVSVIVLVATSNKLSSLVQLLPRTEAILSSMKKPSVIEVR